MYKIPCISQNTEAKTLPADVWIFDHFGQLSPAAVHSADYWFNFGVKWGIHVSSTVIYLCKNPFLLCWNSCKECSELSTHCFWSTESKHSIYLEHSLLIDKCSYKMVNTLPSDIFNSSAISCNFSLQLAKTSLWSFLMFSRSTAKFGQPEQSASFVSVWPCLKSAYHLLAIVSDKAESKKHLWCHCFAWTVFFPSESNALSTHEIQIFPLF